MGACSIYHTIKGELSREDIGKEMDSVRQDQAYQNGHQEGYSGDFQTVDGIGFPNRPAFENLNEALNWCWDNTEKREALCVTYKSKDGGVNTVVAGWGAE